MKSGSLHRLLPFGLIVALLAGVVACSRTPQADVRLMDSAEAVMESAPDSALALMERVDSAAVRGRADRARYALLRSMALDKNYIDVTDFSLLQPAIDYYPRHGTPDQRLKTRYYEGRIHMNRGEDDHALETFLKASADSVECKDSLALVRLYLSFGVMYYKQYKINDHILANSKAANILLARKDTLKALYPIKNLLTGYSMLNQRRPADSILSIIRSIEKTHPEYIPVSTADKITYYIQFNDSSNLARIILRDTIAADQLDVDALMQMVDAYNHLRQPEKARELLESVKKHHGIVDSTQYYLLLSEIAALESEYKEAYECHRKFTHLLETRNSNLFQADLLLVKDRHEQELLAMEEINKRERIINFSRILLIFLIAAVAVVIHHLWKIKLQRERQIDENSRIIRDLKKERDELARIVENSKNLTEEARTALNQRLLTINSLITAAITSKRSFEEEYHKWRDNMLDDAHSFIRSNYMLHKALHPEIIEYLESKGLTETELGYVCLYAIGLRGNDVGAFAGNSRHYHVNTEIRRKLGLDQNHRNLNIYVRKLFEGKITLP